MAKAKQTSAIFGAVTGAVLTVATVLSPTASFAQETTPVAQPLDESLWTQETWELRQANNAAHAHVETTENAVGIVFHAGDDLRERAQAAADKHGVPVEHALQVMLSRLAEDYAQKFAQHGLDAEMFARTNLNAQASGLTYIVRTINSENEITSMVYEDRTGNAVLNLGEANAEIPRVAEAVSYLNQRASLKVDEPAPGLGG